MKKSKRWFWVVVALQAGFLLAWAGYHEHVRRTAPVVVLKVVPVDPRDVVRGQYFQLGYEINVVTTPAAAATPVGAEVWVGLDPAGDFWVAGGIHPDRATAAADHHHAVRGSVASSWRGDAVRINYGIEDYYVPEGTPTPDFRTLIVHATVSSEGRLNIKRVLLNGHPWP